MLCPQCWVLCYHVKVEILRRADLRFAKSCHMSKAGLEMGIDAGRRRLYLRILLHWVTSMRVNSIKTYASDRY
jgi:hypothetical protein